MRNRTSCGAKSRNRMEWPPTYIPTRAQPQPPMWKRGMATALTVVASKPQGGPTRGTSTPRLALVSMAPLGGPVVPEV